MNGRLGKSNSAFLLTVEEADPRTFDAEFFGYRLATQELAPKLQNRLKWTTRAQFAPTTLDFTKTAPI